jgi:hypothetical protein
MFLLGLGWYWRGMGFELKSMFVQWLQLMKVREDGRYDIEKERVVPNILI